MKPRQVFAVFVTLMVIASVLVGLAVTRLTATGKAVIPPSSVTVQIINYAFVPENVSIQANTTITWINNDTVAHYIVSDSGSPLALDSGVINPGGSYSHAFAINGIYPYHCSIHPFMKGNVTVGAGANIVAVDISNLQYHPENIEISVGTTVVWTNSDPMSHTVTSRPGVPVAFDSGIMASSGSFSYTFTVAGSYQYYCMIHPWMSGNVTVTA